MYQIPDCSNVIIVGSVIKDVSELSPNEDSTFWLTRVITNPFFDPLAPKEIQNRSRLTVGIKITRPALGKSAMDLISKGQRALFKGVMGIRRTPFYDNDKNPYKVMIDGTEYQIERTEPLVYLSSFIPITDGANNKDQFDIEAIGNVINDPVIKDKDDRKTLYLKFISNPFRKKFDKDGNENPIEKQNMLRGFYGVKVTSKSLIERISKEVTRGTRIRFVGRVGARRVPYKINHNGNLVQVVGSDHNGKETELEKTELVIYVSNYAIINTPMKGMLEKGMTTQAQEKQDLECECKFINTEEHNEENAAAMEMTAN